MMIGMNQARTHQRLQSTKRSAMKIQLKTQGNRLCMGLFSLALVMGGMFITNVQAQEDGAEGFVTGKLPAPPPAEQVEAGKRVYFTKCVWCHGVNGSGDGPGADRLWPAHGISMLEPLKFGIRQAENCR